MKLQHWLGLLAVVLITTAVVLATIDGRTFERNAYLVILLAVAGTNILIWRKSSRA